MRKKRQKQMPLMHTTVDHSHAQELELISGILENCPIIEIPPRRDQIGN